MPSFEVTKNGLIKLLSGFDPASFQLTAGGLPTSSLFTKRQQRNFQKTMANEYMANEYTGWRTSYTHNAKNTRNAR